MQPFFGESTLCSASKDIIFSFLLDFRSQRGAYGSNLPNLGRTRIAASRHDSLPYFSDGMNLSSGYRHIVIICHRLRAIGRRLICIAYVLTDLTYFAVIE